MDVFEPGDFIRHTGLDKVGLFYQATGDICRVKKNNGKDSTWVAAKCELAEKPEDWRQNETFWSKEKRMSRAAKKRAKYIKAYQEHGSYVKAARALGANCGEIKKACYAKYKCKRFKNFDTTNEKYDDPNEQYHGRECKKCKKKIIGFNWFYCKDCDKKIKSVALSLSERDNIDNGVRLPFRV